MKSICPFVWGGKFCVSLLNVKWRKVNFYSTWSVQLSNFSLPSPCAQCVHLRSSFRSVRADTVHKARTDVRSSCVHKALILHSPFVQCSFIVQSDNTIIIKAENNTHMLFIFFWLPKKHKVRITDYIVHLAFIYRLNIVHRAFIVHFALAFALFLPSAFVHRL